MNCGTIKCSKGWRTNAVARNSLGVNVDGYVMPMFMSQIAIAYNPQTVPNPPHTEDWIIDPLYRVQRRLLPPGEQQALLNRILDPSDTGVTLATLTRASQVLGLRVDIRLSPTRKCAA